MRPLIPLLLFLGTVTLRAQDFPDGRALLDQAAKVLQSGPAYRAQFSGSIEIKATGLQQKLEFSGSLSWEPPDKSRVEGKAGPSDLLVVRNGADTWTYLSANKQYRKTAGACGVDGSAQGAGQLLACDIVLSGLESVRVEREEDVSIGGEAHRCYVVLATYHAGIDGGAAPAVTLWIDERSQIILRRRATAGLRIPRLDQAAEATVDFTLTELALSPQFAGDEFTFVPPKGSSPQTEDMPAAGTQASANAADARPSAAPSRAPGNDVISPPTIFSRAEPAYSREATELRLEGMVPLSIIVQSDGTPTAIVVTKSLGFGLDEAAIDAVRKWRFNPGQKNGESVPVKATVEVNFRFLPSEDGWFVTSAGFDVPEGASVPHLRNAVFPRKPKSGQPCSVTVLLAVDRQGKPGDIRIQAESDRKCEPELVAAIRKWKFEPATKDGVPVETSMIVEFSQ